MTIDAVGKQEREYAMQARLNVLLDIERRLATATVALDGLGVCEQADVTEAGYAALRDRRDQAFIDLARELAAAATERAALAREAGEGDHAGE